ncbi:MAG: GbsR/MarR family transcriptional regulator [Kiritimatiellia bacterium]
MHRSVAEMVDAGGRTAQSFGVSRLFGQIYTLLYLSPEPQSLDALASALGVSKASVSITCRQLEGWGAVKRVWVKGDRKDFYLAQTDLGSIINNGLLSAVNKKLDTAQIQIQRSIELLDDEKDGGSHKEFLKKKLTEAEKYRSKAAKLLNNPVLKHIFAP